MMNLNEFKSWFDGYTEAKKGKLKNEDIKIIEKKLNEIMDNDNISPHCPICIYWPLAKTIPDDKFWISDTGTADQLPQYKIIGITNN